MAYKILYIDDDENLREKFERCFSIAGFQIKTLENACGKLIENVEKYSPDLILLDISMPVISGFDAIKILKDNEATREIPIFFFSNISNPEQIGKGIALGARDYLVKFCYNSKDVVEICTEFLHDPENYVPKYLENVC